MSGRFNTRALVVWHAMRRRGVVGKSASPPAVPRRVLVAHNLLLGDTLMLTPLLAKLRAMHADAEIDLLVPPAFVALYEGRPFGVRALPFAPSDAATARPLFDAAPYDLAIVPADNRFSWIAAAMGARHIVAHAGDYPWTKDWFVDETRPYPGRAAAWGDIVADLVDGPEPPPFARGDWPAPAARGPDGPGAPYAVLHVGASTPLKQWPPERWMALALDLEKRGLAVAWSAGPGEESIVARCDPQSRFQSFAGRLDLARMWHLLANASLLVSPDTGIAHLGRVTFTPTVTLFGPGSALICGPGRFWRDTPTRAVTIDPFPCRDQDVLFRRAIPWVRHCARSTAECTEARCMLAIDVNSVLTAADELLRRPTPESR